MDFCLIWKVVVLKLNVQFSCIVHIIPGFTLPCKMFMFNLEISNKNNSELIN